VRSITFDVEAAELQPIIWSLL